MQICLDDQVIFQGPLRQAPARPKGERVPSFGQSIVFTNERKILDAQSGSCYSCKGAEQPVVCINNQRIESGPKISPRLNGVPVTVRPMTMATGGRPFC